MEVSESRCYNYTDSRLLSMRLIILGILAKYGRLYGLDILRLSHKLKRGTLYTTLKRLADDGLIASEVVETPKGKRGPARRYYELTYKGRELLKREIETWRDPTVDSLIESLRLNKDWQKG